MIRNSILDHVDEIIKEGHDFCDIEYADLGRDRLALAIEVKRLLADQARYHTLCAWVATLDCQCGGQHVCHVCDARKEVTP